MTIVMDESELRPARSTELRPSRLSSADTVATGVRSLASRKLRTLLSALGIAIGIASLVAVMGLSASNRAQLLSELDELGTNLLTARPGLTFGGSEAKLPATAAGQAERLLGVVGAATTRDLEQNVWRSPLSSRGAAPGVDTVATQVDLLDLVAASVATGAWLNDSTAQYDNVVLGSLAAERLGLDRAGTRVNIGDQWFTVVGILEPVALAPELDSAVLIGTDAAERYFGDRSTGASPPPTDVLYVRADPELLDVVRTTVAPTLRPGAANEVAIERPSDALEAAALAETAFNSLFLGLGVVALAVGGIGVANVMVIAVIERRAEIGLRRSLGATRSHIRRQFFLEALLLSALGGVVGVGLGAVVTAAWAEQQGWLIRIPPVAVGGGLAAAFLVGAVAGLYPASRAARLSPVDALRS